MNTALITGCSSGYGLETARHFLAQGWNVIATMRTPRDGLFAQSDRIRILALDVTSPDSIAAAIDAAGPIDALVNNAGIGVVGAFEATPMAHVRKVFETNTFGVMAMVQAVIPQMRERRSGVIVNVTSSVTLAPMPLAAAYTASKQAIEGFTGSLAHELAAFDVRARLVEPGYAPTTRFAANTDIPVMDLIPEAYADFAGPIFAAFANPALTTRESEWPKRCGGPSTTPRRGCAIRRAPTRWRWRRPLESTSVSTLPGRVCSLAGSARARAFGRKPPPQRRSGRSAGWRARRATA